VSGVVELGGRKDWVAKLVAISTMIILFIYGHKISKWKLQSSTPHVKVALSAAKP